VCVCRAQEHAAQVEELKSENAMHKQSRAQALAAA